MQRPNVPIRPEEEYRQLRAITILTFPLGVSLLIPYAAITGLAFPALGLAPMFISTTLGCLMYSNLLYSPTKKAIIDVILTVVYFAFLVPSWLQVLARDWNGAGLVMLGTYGTTTTMINFAIHLFLSVQSVRIIEMPTITWQSSACHECEHHHHHRGLSLAGHQVGFTGAGLSHGHRHAFKGAQQPFIGPNYDDSRDSSEYQTSGFNSPRMSAETLGTNLHTDLGDIADRLV